MIDARHQIAVVTSIHEDAQASSLLFKNVQTLLTENIYTELNAKEPN